MFTLKTYKWEDLIENAALILDDWLTVNRQEITGEVKSSVSSTDTSSIIELELPGIDKKNISIKTKEESGYNILVIEGKTRQGKDFKKSYGFKDSLIDQTKAEYKEGLLILTVPKKEKKENVIQIT